MSSKNFYKVVGTKMYMAPNPKKQFKEKYDLTNYQVQLSQGDNKKFYLYPLNEMLQLNMVKFTCADTEERARWYKALQDVTNKNKIIPY